MYPVRGYYFSVQSVFGQGYYLSLHHLRAVVPHGEHQVKDVHLRHVTYLLQQLVQRHERSRPSHTRAARATGKVRLQDT